MDSGHSKDLYTSWLAQLLFEDCKTGINQLIKGMNLDRNNLQSEDDPDVTF